MIFIELSLFLQLLILELSDAFLNWINMIVIKWIDQVMGIFLARLLKGLIQLPFLIWTIRMFSVNVFFDCAFCSGIRFCQSLNRFHWITICEWGVCYAFLRAWALLHGVGHRSSAIHAYQIFVQRLKKGLCLAEIVDSGLSLVKLSSQIRSILLMAFGTRRVVILCLLIYHLNGTLA